MFYLCSAKNKRTSAKLRRKWNRYVIAAIRADVTIYEPHNIDRCRHRIANDRLRKRVEIHERRPVAAMAKT